MPRKSAGHQTTSQ